MSGHGFGVEAVRLRRRRPTRSELRSTLAWMLLNSIAAYIGRATTDELSPSLVWPAAGVAVLWFALRGRGSRLLGWCPPWWEVAAMVASTYAVMRVTGTPAAESVLFVAANVLAAAGVLAVGHRLAPHLLGFGGTESVSRVSDLWRIAASSLVGVALASLVLPILWLVMGGWTWQAQAILLGRNAVCVLTITTVGLLVASDRRHRPAAPDDAAPAAAGHQQERLETLTIWVSSVLVYTMVFAYVDGLPVAFLALVCSVWSGSRLRPTSAAVHDLTMGVIAVAWTLADSGPFARIEDLHLRAVVALTFVGVVFLVGMSLSLGRAERDQALRALAAARDGAARQAALLQTVLATMDEGVALLDDDGRVLFHNPAVSHLVEGHDVDDAVRVDSAVLALVNGEDRDAGTRALRGEQVEQDVSVTVNDGREHILSVRAMPITPNGGVPQALVIISDVTAERSARDRLVSFAGVVAHDLLNPLTIVHGWADVVAEVVETEYAREADDRLSVIADANARIQRGADRMSSMVQGLLDQAVSRNTPLQAQHVALGDLVASVVAERAEAPHSTEHVAQVHVGRLHDVYADPILTRQLIANLIDNSIKYTPPDRSAQIDVSSWRAADGFVRIEIADHGSGVSEGHHAAIFDDFHRVDPDGLAKGHGLGLAICRRIVQRHGGTISAAENSGGGTRVVFTLPAGASPRGRAPRPVAALVRQHSLADQVVSAAATDVAGELLVDVAHDEEGGAQHGDHVGDQAAGQHL